ELHLQSLGCLTTGLSEELRYHHQRRDLPLTHRRNHRHLAQKKNRGDHSRRHNHLQSHRQRLRHRCRRSTSHHRLRRRHQIPQRPRSDRPHRRLPHRRSHPEFHSPIVCHPCRR